jgi:hypothetical protein
MTETANANNLNFWYILDRPPIEQIFSDFVLYPALARTALGGAVTPLQVRPVRGLREKSRSPPFETINHNRVHSIILFHVFSFLVLGSVLFSFPLWAS